jgi:hypothetical protein
MIAWKVVSELSKVTKAVNWLDGAFCKIIESGKAASFIVGTEEEIREIMFIFDGAQSEEATAKEDTRTAEQNSKQWAMYTDLSKQLTWHGSKLDPGDWKDLLCHEWKPQQIIPAISGGFCVLNARTSKAKKKEFSDLVEIIYAFGSEHGVKWSEKALECYQEYRQAK